MQISIPIKIEKVSTNVVDNTEVFKVIEYRNFAPNILMQFGGYIYQNVAGLIEIPPYSAEETYSLGDLVYKEYVTASTESGIHQVTGVGDTGQVPQQPAGYTVDSIGETSPSTWSNRYVKLSDSYSGTLTYTVGAVKHTFEDQRYESGIIYHTREYISGTSIGQSVRTPVVCSLEVSNYDVEEAAYVPDNEFYLFNAFISIDNALYARTHIEADIQYETTTPEYTFTAISSITEVDGFVKIRPTLDNAPFDHKHYSTATKTTSVTYTFLCTEDFNTLALGNVIGNTVNVTFKNSSGTTVGTPISGYEIDNSRDEDDVLEGVGATVILYADVALIGKGGSITFTVYGEHVSLGTIICGLNVDAGFTNLVFSNKFVDYSPYEKDNWGNITYIDGVRVQVHTGTVSILVSKYDMINRLITSIGGKTIILNGSDTLDNTEPNNSSTFSSTMIIGRWKVSEIKTKLKDDRMAQMANYGFTIEEQV